MKADLVAIEDWYDAQRQGLGAEFRDEVTQRSRASRTILSYIPGALPRSAACALTTISLRSLVSIVRHLRGGPRLRARQARFPFCPRSTSRGRLSPACPCKADEQGCREPSGHLPPLSWRPPDVGSDPEHGFARRRSRYARRVALRCSNNDFRGCSTASGQRPALPGRPDRHQCGLVVGCAPDGRDHPVLLLPPDTGDRRTCFLPPVRSHDRRGNRLARLATMVPFRFLLYTLDPDSLSPARLRVLSFLRSPECIDASVRAVAWMTSGLVIVTLSFFVLHLAGYLASDMLIAFM